MSIKSYRRPVAIFQNATYTEQTAGKVYLSVYSGSTSDTTTDDFRFVGQVWRSGSLQTAAKMTYSSATGLLTVENAGAYVVASGDTINVMGIFN